MMGSVSMVKPRLIFWFVSWFVLEVFVVSLAVVVAFLRMSST